MTTNFAELLYGSLPGLYRDKDGGLELRRFLDLAALPLEEIERSIGELYLDFYLNTCRDAFVPLIGSVLGIEPDPRLPAKAQRIEAADALLSYQSKGLASRLEIAARQLTTFAVTTVDFSRRVTVTPFVQDTNPLFSRRNAAAGEKLVPGSLAGTFDIRDPLPMTRLGLADDPAPYTFDLRSPRQPTDRSGRMHFDNYGFFFTPGRVIAGGRPALLVEGPPAVFSFDGRPLPPGDPEGTPLQLQDGLDGTPLTRAKLSGHEEEYCGPPRGFAIRIGGVNLLDPASTIDAHVVSADLSNPAAPADSTGAPLSLAAHDVAVDPELGRFVMDVVALGTSSDQVRVDYLLGPARVVRDASPSAVDGSAPDLFQFSAAAAPLRDAIDGALIAAKLRLGRSAIAFHGTPRGWVIRQNGADVSGALTASIQSLASGTPAAAVAPGTIAIDPDRGRFQFPAGVLAADDIVTVDFCDEDVAAEHQVLAGFAQRAARLVPAGVTAVVLDSRKTPVDPASLA